MSTLLERLRTALAPHYEVERELASGGMGTVFLASDPKLDRKVAIKILRPDLASDTASDRFLREARILARLSHPNVVPVYQAGEADGLSYYVMEYVEGETLQERLERGALPKEDALKLANDLLSALEAAHERGIVHRDVKPSNIFLVGDRALLGDFGIAKRTEDTGEGLTGSGQRVGTPGYMAPEQLAGDAATPRTDLYAVGMTLYEALTGRKWSLLTTTAEADWSGVATGLANVLQRALGWSPEDRWVDVAEFRQALVHSVSQSRARGASPTRLGALLSSLRKRRLLPAGHRTEPPAANAETEELLRLGRSALRDHAWQRAFDHLSAAADAGALSAEELEDLAEAAWWVGRSEDCIRARERAYHTYLQQGKQKSAMRLALALAEDFFHKLAASVASGWLKRAERLARDLPECVEHGYLQRLQTMIAIDSDIDRALELADGTLEIADRFGDTDLQGLALQDRGRILISQGRVVEGMACIDEAMAAALGGELSPHTTGRIYCNMMSTCEKLADYRRAKEWSEAGTQWCEPYALSGFPGICRVHRAEIMRLHGAWTEAENEARRACDELEGFLDDVVGEAFYVIGEIKLRLGDLPSAEKAFHEAHRKGRDPVPGLPLLRLAEGKPVAAKALIEPALADDTRVPLDRARLLPAYVEIALATGDLGPALAAVEEIEGIAAEYGSQAHEASAAAARGALQMAEGNSVEAEVSLRRAVKLWREIDLPYETAKTRVLLAGAFQESGSHEIAELELQTAKATFEELGAPWRL